MNRFQNTRVVIGYALLGTFLAISVSCNIGFVVFCFRQSKKIKTPSIPSTVFEMQTKNITDDRRNYEGLDLSKVDNVRNIYDTIQK
ncbi:uncharacterized protein LOC132564760 [Ylistrum balloti]|uniref:uncharacterized protein LOC132564760 n=1 Tax=Ylistrum balloti TaxID=509963 RepID=UPI0029059CC1|nr:uncharacterized protein LOC132564760 [Ylistrum balloti]